MVGDPVTWFGSFVTYMVIAIDADKETADTENPKGGTIGLHRDVPWSELSVLDESQNALPGGERRHRRLIAKDIKQFPL